MIDGPVVQQLVDQLRCGLVPVLVRQRQAKVVEEEDHLESFRWTKDSSSVLVELGHNRVEDCVLGNPRGQVQCHRLLCFKVETLCSLNWHQIFVNLIH